MKRDRASRIKGFIIDVQNYKALHKQLLFTPDLLPEDGRQVMERIDWQAGSVTHTSDTCAITEASRHTPPM